MKKSSMILAGIFFLLLFPFVVTEDKIDIKVFFIYPNGDIVEQNVVTKSGFVDFTDDNLKICNDLLYMIEEVLPDYLNARQKQMLDLAQHHIDLANTTGDFNGELEKAIAILKDILFEIT